MGGGARKGLEYAHIEPRSVGDIDGDGLDEVWVDLHAEVSVLYDREGQTLTVWFSDRHQEHLYEETGDEVVLMKDSAGRVIGFEKLNFSIPETDGLRIALETSPA